MKITHVDDYMELLQAKFPQLKKEDIKRIVSYGWKQYYYINSCGGDIFTQDEEGFWHYSGWLTKDSIQFTNLYRNKLTVKLRTMFKRKHILWNGYYYFSLDDKQWEDYNNQIHRRGRPRKTFSFGDVTLYKLFDECKIKSCNNKYIFKVPMITDCGFFIRKRDFKSSEAELVLEKEPTKLKDMLVNDNKYEFL